MTSITLEYKPHNKKPILIAITVTSHMFTCTGNYSVLNNIKIQSMSQIYEPDIFRIQLKPISS
jgi:hypothetical protein